MARIKWNENTQIWEIAANPAIPNTLFNHLPVANPTLPLDIANKQYVDAAAAPPGVYVPYTGAVNHVNLGVYGLTAGGLQINGAASVSVNLYVSGRTVLYGGTGTAYSNGSLEIQMTSWPRVSFHWAGVVASQIGMNSAGEIVAMDNPGTSYANFRAANIYGTGTLFMTSYINTSAYIMSTGVIYPGTINTGVQQSSYYLASHTSYGLYTNTGMYIASTLYMVSPSYAIYGSGHALFVGDTPTTSFWGNYGGMMVANSNVALIGVRSIGYSVEGGMNAWVNIFYMGSWTGHQCIIRAGNLDKIVIEPSYGFTKIQNGALMTDNIGINVAPSGSPLRIVGLSAGPSAAGDVYNNGDGILRIG